MGDIYDNMMEDGSYALLLDALRKDLQLDATTDVLPGSLVAALQRDVSRIPVFSHAGPVYVSWGEAVTGASPTVQNGGSNDWFIGGGAIGAVQISFNEGNTNCVCVSSYGGARSLGGSTITTQASDGVAPVLSSFSGGTLTSGIVVCFMAVHY